MDTAAHLHVWKVLGLCGQVAKQTPLYTKNNIQFILIMQEDALSFLKLSEKASFFGGGVLKMFYVVQMLPFTFFSPQGISPHKKRLHTYSTAADSGSAKENQFYI